MRACLPSRAELRRTTHVPPTPGPSILDLRDILQYTQERSSAKVRIASFLFAFYSHHIKTSLLPRAKPLGQLAILLPSIKVRVHSHASPASPRNTTYPPNLIIQIAHRVAQNTTNPRATQSELSALHAFPISQELLIWATPRYFPDIATARVESLEIRQHVLRCLCDGRRRRADQYVAKIKDDSR